MLKAKSLVLPSLLASLLSLSAKAETRCESLENAEFADSDEAWGKEVKPTSKILMHAFFTGGLTEPEDEYLRSCIILSDGRVSIMTKWGASPAPTRTHCKMKRVLSWKVKEIEKLLPEVRAIPVTTESGICDDPASSLRLREGDLLTALDSSISICEERQRRISSSADQLLKKTLTLCESTRHYDERLPSDPGQPTELEE